MTACCGRWARHSHDRRRYPVPRPRRGDRLPAGRAWPGGLRWAGNRRAAAPDRAAGREYRRAPGRHRLRHLAALRRAGPRDHRRQPAATAVQAQARRAIESAAAAPSRGGARRHGVRNRAPQRRRPQRAGSHQRDRAALHHQGRPTPAAAGADRGCRRRAGRGRPAAGRRDRRNRSAAAAAKPVPVGGRRRRETAAAAAVHAAAVQEPRALPLAAARPADLQVRRQGGRLAQRRDQHRGAAWQLRAGGRERRRRLCRQRARRLRQPVADQARGRLDHGLRA